MDNWLKVKKKKLPYSLLLLHRIFYQWYRLYQTQQMCDDVLHYQVLYESQVNKYVAPDGTRPFADAPDSQISAVTVKYINNWW